MADGFRDSVTGRGYYLEVRKKLARFSYRTWLLQTRDNPVHCGTTSCTKKTMFEKKPPRRDRNIRTPFRDKARDHSTESVTGAELRKRTRCYRCRQTWTYGERVSESSTEGHSPISSQEFLFARRCLCTIAIFVTSYMLFDGASKTVVGCNSDPKHPEFIGLILGPARGLTDHWSTATCGGFISCSTMVRSTYGERVSESSTEGRSSTSQEFLFAGRCLCTFE